MIWNLKTILLLLVVLFVGYGIGLLEMYLWQSKKVRQLENALKAAPQAETDKQPAEAKSVESPVEQKEEPDLLRISAEPAGGLRFLLEGKRLVTPQEVTPEQRNLLVQLLLQIRPWVEGKTTTPASPPSAVSIAKLSQAAPEPAAEPEATVEKPAAAPASIVTQIDDLLQKRLAGTPLATRGIRLQDSSTGGVVFWVGIQHYDSVEAIPDPEVVAAIRAAIAEWEKGTG